MMHGMEKSDSGIVAVKSANKGMRVSAESMERRTEPKGNLEGQSTRRTQSRENVTQAADRIRQFVQREPRERLTALLHHVTVAALGWAFFALKKDVAAGADGMTWRMYEEGLEGRLADLFWCARIASASGSNSGTKRGTLSASVPGEISSPRSDSHAPTLLSGRKQP